MLELGFQDKVLNWIWLILIDACWFWLMLIDSDWFLLTLIDSDWCWLMPIDASASADAVTHSSNTSWVTHVRDHLCLSPAKCNVPMIISLTQDAPHHFPPPHSTPTLGDILMTAGSWVLWCWLWNTELHKILRHSVQLWCFQTTI